MPLLSYKGTLPSIDTSAWVAPTATITGSVTIGEDSSVFFGCSIRGDIQKIIIGKRTNIQDNAVIHTSVTKNNCLIGDGVTIGHGAILHGCQIDNFVIVGMGAIILDDAQIGPHCIIGAGTLITQRMKIPEKSLVFGNPGKVVRVLTDKEYEETIDSSRRYVLTSKEYASLFNSSTPLNV